MKFIFNLQYQEGMAMRCLDRPQARDKTKKMPPYVGSRKSFSRLSGCRAVCLAVLTLSSWAWASPSSSSISGVVVDPSGAVIVGATVTLQNIGNGQKESRITSSDGSYGFVPVPAGLYRLRTEAAGFKPDLRDGLAVKDTDRLVVDIGLALNTENTTVEVSGDAQQIDPSSVLFGGTIHEKKLEDVPLNGRSFTDEIALWAGVVPVSSQQPNAVLMSGCTSTSPSGDLNPGNLSVSGQRETANGFAVNGINVEETFSMGTAIVPNLDAIQELSPVTGNQDAQYGNFGGGQVLVTTKSGTDQIHGSVFEFLRDTGFDARNYFSLDRAQYNQNQFGGTLGGPISKDRLFFFADYQGTRLTQGIDTGLITVPSEADRGGNLIDLAGQLSGQVNGPSLAASLSAKLGYPVRPGESYYQPNCTSGSECVFPGAVIPEAAWSTPATRLLQYIPAPNQGMDQFSTAAENQALRDDKAGIRIDGNTPWGSMSGYYFFDDYSMNSPYPTGQGGASVPGFNALTVGRSQLLSFGLTKAVGANLLNEFHVSYLRDANVVGRPQGGVGPSLASQGFVDGAGNPSIYAIEPSIEGIENVAFNDFTIGVDTTGLNEANNTYQWIDNVSKVIGNHTLKFGGGFHLDQININPDAIYNGSFTFTGSATGSDFADFLLGLPSTYAQGDSNRFYLRSKYAGVFAQDGWQISHGLTLTYGVRWDLLPPWREKYNQLQTVVLGQQSVVYPGAPQGLVFPGDPGVPDTLAPTKHTNFAPRVGFAYSPAPNKEFLRGIWGDTGKTVIRGGYGINYTAFEGLSAGIMSANPPYGYDYTSLAPPTFADPFVVAASGQSVLQPFPETIPSFGASASHPNPNVNWSQYLPITGVPSFYRGNVVPYTENYTLSVEREIVANTFLSAGYIGSQGHHQLALVSANTGNPAACLALNAEGATPTCGPFGEGGTYTLPNGQVVVGTRGPFSSQFDAVTYQKTIGNSGYNAFQLNLRHRGRAFDVLVGYTYGKSIDLSSSLAEAVNPINPSLSRAISAFDMRHNFVASYNYNLPFSVLLRRENRWTQGWSVSGITRFSTGLPVTLYNNTDSSLLGTIPNGINNNGIDTPYFTPGNLAIDSNPRGGRSAFNPLLFSLPALGNFGNVPRRFFYGPGLDNFDMALHKVFPLTEAKSLEFRAEAFNIWNHTQFFGPAAVEGNISSANFGRIVNADAAREMQAAVKFHF
ncbi:MAG TPA: carboxypeptidase regulatory-like domain-containing protein [Bacteroidota bacterium]|nr:carboxypeptidase regulatory-like domain-containing protein [Bacteroidota bacterium]